MELLAEVLVGQSKERKEERQEAICHGSWDEKDCQQIVQSRQSLESRFIEKISL